MLDLFWLTGPFAVGWLLWLDWYHHWADREEDQQEEK